MNNTERIEKIAEHMYTAAEEIDPDFTDCWEDVVLRLAGDCVLLRPEERQERLTKFIAELEAYVGSFS